ncbi:MAG: DNA replication/repair protein RecF [Clostridiales bacterium]
MKLNYLLVNNFRNYDFQKIDFNDNINIIRGFNAQGKSNLLEAVAYLSLASSFRGAADIDILGWEKDFFRLEGSVQYQKNGGGENYLAVAYNRQKRKIWKINGQNKRKTADILGHFHTVIFSPEDLSLVKSGPAARRKYLNRQIVQLYPQYYSLLLKYNQILKHKNALLKKRDYNLPEEIIPWNQQLAAYGAAIYEKRFAIFIYLQEIAARLHQNISPGEKLDLVYKSFLPQKELFSLSTDDLKAVLEKKFKDSFQLERIRGAGLYGPHRDDLEMFINNNSLKTFGSQGQQRSGALSLKLAEMELAYQKIGEYPVLLLDDVMSELDEKRRSSLLKMMNDKTQTFITATDLNFYLPGGKTFLISQGSII